MNVNLLGYRPWSGQRRGAWRTPWPIARVALKMIFRQKLFWLLYVAALLNFLLFASGIYLFSQIDIEALTNNRATPQMIKFWTDMKMTLQKQLKLAGDAETYRNFFWFQGYFTMAILALAGATLVGGDYQHGSLPFYLSKPIHRWHYLIGKMAAVAVFISMLTTVPAILLFIEGMLLSEEFVNAPWPLLWGVLGYGLTLTVVLSPLVVMLASWLRRTVPLVMVWAGLLFFCRIVADVLVDLLRYDPHWRLIDLWNLMFVVGSWCLGVTPDRGGSERVRQLSLAARQPPVEAALLVLAGVFVVCIVYLHLRIRAVEVVT
ncbi:MAG TPA: ABC transporter permease subunit [Gemmatales bacterium]|nr:ABC transporter permease subunit [Gemmatales bacterium]HMP60697.1 ABC transporter permease subunit [Gemmatales bacterium]